VYAPKLARLINRRRKSGVLAWHFADRFEGVTGSEIRKIFSLLEDPDIISFAGGNPSPHAFPQKELAQISERLIREDGAWVLQYGATKGVTGLLDHLGGQYADIMRAHDDIIILAGSSQGIELFTRALLNEGDTMLAESPSFLGALQTFRLARANVQTVSLRGDGVDLDELERKLKSLRPKFFYVIPTFQNPSGITASEEKRKEIYRLCGRYGAMILEDDPYSELRYGGKSLPAVKSYDDDGIVCRLGSYSKTVSPGLRVGYAIARRDVIDKMNLLKQGADVHTSNLSQAIVLEFLRDGYAAHVEALCGRYRAHRDAMLETLDRYAPEGVSCTRPEGGLFIWMTLPGHMDADGLFLKSVERKVAFVPGRTFYARACSPNTLRLNFSMPNLDDIELGIRKLCGVIKESM
jgi:2-aminoadipate transaminase